MEDVHNFKSAEELILDYASTYLSKPEHDLFAIMLTALQQPVNRGAAKLMDNSARVLNQTNFQSGVASYVLALRLPTRIAQFMLLPS